MGHYVVHKSHCRSPRRLGPTTTRRDRCQRSRLESKWRAKNEVSQTTVCSYLKPGLPPIRDLPQV